MREDSFIGRHEGIFPGTEEGVSSVIRNLVKDKLLFIAPTVPLYDQNSGDLRLYKMLEILSGSYEIVFLALYYSGDNPIHDDKYVTSLEHLGVRVLVKNFSIRDILRNNKFKASILEFYFVAEHFLPRIKLLQPACPVIIDTVDVHYYRLILKYKITKDKGDLQVAEKTKKRELDVYNRADVVITVTEEDAKVLLNDCPDLSLRIIPNIHHLAKPKSTPNRNAIIFIGGFGHEPNVDAVLYFCREILPRIKQKIPSIKFTIVGSNPPDEIRALRNDHITVTGYVPSIVPFLHNACISVAPLRYGAGMKGKIGEAMAHGLPVVTTSIGAQGMNLVNRENAIITDSAEDFAHAVVELLQTDILYKRIQKNAFDHIMNNYSFDQVSKIIGDFISGLEALSVKKLSLLEKTSFFFAYALDIKRRKLRFTVL